MKIEELDFSVSTYHRLAHAGIDTVEKLRELSDDDLFRIKNMNRRNITEIREKLDKIAADRHQMTNADRIRAISYEELAEFLSSIAYGRETPWSEPFAEKFCKSCPTTTFTCEAYHHPMELHECDFSDGKCPHGSDIIWWLQQPAEDSAND